MASKSKKPSRSSQRAVASIRSGIGGGGIGSGGVGSISRINTVEIVRSDGTKTNVIIGSSDFNREIAKGGVQRTDTSGRVIVNIQDFFAKQQQIGVPEEKVEQISSIRDIDRLTPEQIRQKQRVKEERIRTGRVGKLKQKDIIFRKKGGLVPVKIEEVKEEFPTMLRREDQPKLDFIAESKLVRAKLEAEKKEKEKLLSFIDDRAKRKRTKEELITIDQVTKFETEELRKQELKEAPKRAKFLQPQEKFFKKAEILAGKVPVITPALQFLSGVGLGVVQFEKAVLHPVKTAKGVKDMVVHPIRTGQEILTQLSTRGSAFIGEAIGFNIIPTGGIKIISKIRGVKKTVLLKQYAFDEPVVKIEKVAPKGKRKTIIDIKGEKDFIKTSIRPRGTVKVSTIGGGVKSLTEIEGFIKQSGKKFKITAVQEGRGLTTVLTNKKQTITFTKNKKGDLFVKTFNKKNKLVSKKTIKNIKPKLDPLITKEAPTIKKRGVERLDIGRKVGREPALGQRKTARIKDIKIAGKELRLEKFIETKRKFFGRAETTLKQIDIATPKTEITILGKRKIFEQTPATIKFVKQAKHKPTIKTQTIENIGGNRVLVTKLIQEPKLLTQRELSFISFSEFQAQTKIKIKPKILGKKAQVSITKVKKKAIVEVKRPSIGKKAKQPLKEPLISIEELEAVIKTKPKLKLIPIIKTKAVSKAKAISKAETKAKAKTISKAKAISKPKAISKAKAKAISKAKAKTIIKTKAIARTKAISKIATPIKRIITKIPKTPKVPPKVPPLILIKLPILKKLKPKKKVGKKKQILKFTTTILRPAKSIPLKKRLQLFTGAELR